MFRSCTSGTNKKQPLVIEIFIAKCNGVYIKVMDVIVVVMNAMDSLLLVGMRKIVIILVLVMGQFYGMSQQFILRMAPEMDDFLGHPKILLDIVLAVFLFLIVL